MACALCSQRCCSLGVDYVGTEEANSFLPAVVSEGSAFSGFKFVNVVSAEEVESAHNPVLGELHKHIGRTGLPIFPNNATILQCEKRAIDEVV